MTDEDAILESSFIAFAEETLNLPLYDWQCRAVEPFDEASEHLVQVSLATPNGSGKSAYVIPVLILGWLAMYPKGLIALTTADGKQLDGQVMPALEAHRSKFPEWKFIEREIRTPTGGRFHAFTTDQAGRAEGWHKLDDCEGPLLIIVDEGKTVPEDIFSALDRCTYNAILICSSPGKMRGRFYESQFKPELDFIAIAVGLKDCPHITQDKIDRIIATHGPNSPFTRSALHGEFIESFDGEPVYYAYNSQQHEFDRGDKGYPWWPNGAILVASLDVGTMNATCIMAVKKVGDHIYVWIMHEIILSGSDTDRQCIELLKVLANEFPFWNKATPACPQTLFFCDPAARNSSFTARGPTSSALKVMHTHKIFPGYKLNLGLQPSIATVNRLLKSSHEFDGRTVFHFHIDKRKSPVLCRAMAAEYRYASEGRPGWGEDVPMKGKYVNFVDHICDAMRYGVCNVLNIAEELHPEGMKAKYPPVITTEPVRRI